MASSQIREQSVALLLTDEVLEHFICNTCHKFLSVKPTKVYPNRRIKCGRCSEDKDAGVVSSFNLLADKCIFKCVNRFDGCRRLLTHSEVGKHELECVGKSFVCPICSASTLVPTFLMVSHFKKEHENMYLSIPSFFINVNESLQIIKLFLYRHYDRLFIVVFKTDAPFENITMSIMLLGDPEDARNISYRFTICTGTDFEVHLSEKSCVVFDVSNIGALEIEQIEIPKHLGIVNITFKMNMVDVAGMINLPSKYHSLSTEQTDEIDKIYFGSRFIYLDDSFRKTYSNFSIGLNSISIMKDNKFEIFFCCLNCSLMDYSIYKEDTSCVYIVHSKLKYFCLCYSCSKYTYEIYKKTPSNMLEEVTLKRILFMCLWKCGSFFNITSLNKHEINCPLQPIQKCPVNYCKYQSKLFDIKQHMMMDHSEAFSKNFEEQNGVFIISLLIAKSPIKHFVIVGHMFIFIEIIWDGPKWNISVHKCTASEKYDAVALLFDSAHSFLDVVKQNQTVKICHMEKLKIKCYYEKKRNE